MRGFLKRILFPIACPVCGSLKHQDSVEKSGLCPECKDKYLNRKPVLEMPTFAPCAVAAVCPAFYGEDMRDAMRKFKFGGETFAGECFAKMIREVLFTENIKQDFDFVTCVPLSEERFAERGFNQSEEVARELAKLAEIPFEETLTRTVQGRSQSSLLTEERREKEGQFEILDKEKTLGKNILLIDDIITTGSTLAECSAILKSAGASTVTIAVVAGGRKEFL